MAEFVSDVAFTSSVKAQQEQRGSRAGYRKMAQKRDWKDTVTPELAAFLAERDSVYLATSSADGQPYIQHRGGPKGFLHVVDDRTIGFVDFAGNRQYITLSNLADNPRAFLFLMDYANRRRVKIWGRAKIVEDDPALLARLMPAGYGAWPERAVLFTIAAWDVNCPQHIVQRFDEAAIRRATKQLARRVEALEQENRVLRERLAGAA